MWRIAGLWDQIINAKVILKKKMKNEKRKTKKKIMNHKTRLVNIKIIIKEITEISRKHKY